MLFVPENRLIIVTGATLLPVSIAALFIPGAFPLLYVLMAALLLAGALDLLLSVGKPKKISTVLPDQISMAKERASSIEIQIANNGAPTSRITIYPLLPDGFHCDNRKVTAYPKKNSTPHTHLWQCTPRKQGRFHIKKCHMEIPSRLGLWTLRSSLATDCEIRVYPDLASDKNALAAIFMDKNPGLHLLRHAGKGSDFEQLRDYIPGDSLNDIHWKATAKRNTPMSKIYQVERTRDIYFVIDKSRLSARNASQYSRSASHESPPPHGNAPGPAADDTIFDRYLSAALLTGLATEKQGDNFGIILFSDTVKGFIKAGRGKAHYSACRELVYTHGPERVAPDFTELFTFASAKIRKRSLLIVLTSLDDPVICDTFMDGVHLISNKHLVTVGMLNPSTAKPLFSKPDVTKTDHIYTSLSGHILWNTLRETEKKLRKKNTGFSLLDNREIPTQLINHYVTIKKRQLL